MTEDELRLIRSQIRPLDCGVHYCRYCDAGTSNHWEHAPWCPYEQSVQLVDSAKALIDAALAPKEQP